MNLIYIVNYVYFYRSSFSMGNGVQLTLKKYDINT